MACLDSNMSTVNSGINVDARLCAILQNDFCNERDTTFIITCEINYIVHLLLITEITGIDWLGTTFGGVHAYLL